MILLGGILALRSWRRGALHAAHAGGHRRRARAAPPGLDRRSRCAWATRVVLVGHGIPFWLASAIYVTGSILILQRLSRDEDERRYTVRGLRQGPGHRRWRSGVITSARVPGAVPGAHALILKTYRKHLMLQGLSDLGHAYLSFHESHHAGVRAGRRVRRHRHGHPARPVGDAGHRAADHADDQAAGQRRDPGADLLLRRRALRRLAHGHPAEHPRHRRQRGVVRRRLCAGNARSGRPRDRHRHVRRLRQHLFGVLCLAMFTPTAGRGRAVSSARSSSSGCRCSASPCRAASSAAIRSRAG